MPRFEIRFSDPQHPYRAVDLTVLAGPGTYCLPTSLRSVINPITGDEMPPQPQDYWLCEVRLTWINKLTDEWKRILPSAVGLPEFDQYFGGLEPYVADFVPWDVINALISGLRDWPERQRKRELHQQLANQINNLLIALPLGIHNQLLAPLPVMLDQVATSRP